MPPSRPAHSILPLGLESRSAWSPPAAVWTAFCFLLAYLLFLGKNRLLGLDEAMYAKAALSAAREGAWLPLFFEGAPFWEKPPLVLWLQGIFLWLLGPQEEAVRLGSALAGAGTLYFVHRLGEFFAGSRWAGFVCALLLGLQPHFILYARLGTMDMPLLLCLTGAWWGLAKALTVPDGPARERAILGTGLWCVLGVLVKSWFGLVLLPAMTLVLAWRKPGVGFLRAFFWKVFLPTALAVAAWLLLYRMVYGHAFWQWEFGHNVLDRLKSGSLASGSTDPTHALKFYGVLAQEGLAFLWPLLPLGFGLWVREMRQRRKEGAWVAAAWVGCFFFLYYLSFITCSMATLINYLLPLLPMAALGMVFLLGRDRTCAGWAGGVFLLAAFNGLLDFSFWVMTLPLSFFWVATVWWKFPYPKAGRGLQTLGLFVLLAASGWKAQHYLRHPPDPNRVWVQAVLNHPARVPGETLLFLGEHTDARVLGFYSDYHVKVLTRMPGTRPQEALLFQQGPQAVFLPPAER